MPRSYISSAPGGGSSGIAIGDTVTGATAGSVFFAGAAGILAQDNAGFFWDDTNNVLKLNNGAGGSNAEVLRIATDNLYYGGAIKFYANGAPWASILGSYGGGLTFETPTTRFLDFGNAGVTPNVRISGYSYESGGNSMLITPSSATTVPIKTALAASQTADAFQIYASDGTTKLANFTATAALDMLEQTAPAAPAANSVRLYAVDNGAGKTQLMALFSSGAAQQIAIQP